MRAFRLSSRVVLVLALAALFGNPGRVMADDDPPPKSDAFERAVSSSRAKFVKELLGLTRWAVNKRVSAFRHRVYNVVLLVAPDHKLARKVLGFTRAKGSDGWVREKFLRKRKDYNEKVLATAEDKLQTVLTEHKDRVLRAIESNDGLAVDRVEGAIDVLVRLMPGDQALRAYGGNVEFRGRWVHPASKAGAERRSEILGVASRALVKAQSDIRVDDKGRKVGWQASWTTGRHVVRGTLSESLVKRACLLTTVASACSDYLFGEIERKRGPHLAMLLHGRDEALQIVEANPDWKSHAWQLKHVASITMSPATVIAYHTDPNHSKMSCVRSAFANALRHAIPGEFDRGWIFEGVGQRLCWYAALEHGPPFIQFDPTGQRGVASINTFPKKANEWMRAATVVLRRDGPGVLSGILTRRLNAMGVDDAVVAYGLAAYLFEAHPTKVLTFLSASAKRHDPIAYIEEILGVTLPLLTRQLIRWLDETIDLEGGR